MPRLNLPPLTVCEPYERPATSTRARAISQPGGGAAAFEGKCRIERARAGVAEQSGEIHTLDRSALEPKFELPVQLCRARNRNRPAGCPNDRSDSRGSSIQPQINRTRVEQLRLTRASINRSQQVQVCPLRIESASGHTQREPPIPLTEKSLPPGRGDPLEILRSYLEVIGGHRVEGSGRPTEPNGGQAEITVEIELRPSLLESGSATSPVADRAGGRRRSEWRCRSDRRGGPDWHRADRPPLCRRADGVALHRTGTTWDRCLESHPECGIPAESCWGG